jgi:Cu-Zn family superoxide dismutase
MTFTLPAPLKLAVITTIALAAAGCAQAMQGHGHAHGAMPEGAVEVSRAKAEIAGEGITGQATLIEYQHQTGKVVRVVLHVKGTNGALAPGRHGVHLHAVGACVAPFTSAGGHFDPGPASNTDPDVNHPYHLGDLPNLEVNAQGEGHLDAVTTRVTLSDGPLTVFDSDGTAIIIHANPDQGVSGPAKSGVSGGPRIACGVVTR